jgi:DNA-binding IclR family transcriptional regulator
VTRPALSALRAIEIIDFMSQAPSQAYTLSELARHTGANVASCHAILNVLTARGYLTRHPTHKTYRLSLSLAAIGEAVAASEPILDHARAAAEKVVRQTGLSCVVTARTGEDIMCLARAQAPGQRAQMRIGQRVPLRPPLGATYYAWAAAEEVDSWIARAEGTDPEQWRAALALVRERGFLVTLSSPQQREVRRIFAAPPDTRRAKVEKTIEKALQDLERVLYQPREIARDARYDVDIITAPIFDRAGEATYALTLSGLPGGLPGEDVLQHARVLMEACADVMRDSDIRPTPRRA